MTKWLMHKYVVTGVTKKGLSLGEEKLWSREVNATDVNDAKNAALTDWNGKMGIHLFRVRAKRVGPPSMNLSGWKEA